MDILSFFQSFLFATMLQQALLALSLYAPMMAGQLSLASPGFYALGGYLAAVMLTAPGFETWREALGQWIYPVTWLLSGLASALLGVIIGVPALRLRGIYLALATIAFVQIVQALALNLSITGGAVGLFNIPQPFGFTGNGQFVYIFLPMLLLTMLFFYKLERSRTGRALRAIREDELAADAMGVPPLRYKVQAFVIGAVIAGVVGAVSAPFLNTWNARQGTFDASVNYLAYTLIGGSRNLWGPVLGALVLSALPEVLRPLAQWRLVINGLVLVLASLYLPRGLTGLLDRPRKLRRPQALRATLPPAQEKP